MSKATKINLIVLRLEWIGDEPLHQVERCHRRPLWIVGRSTPLPEERWRTKLHAGLTPTPANPSVEQSALNLWFNVCRPDRWG